MRLKECSKYETVGKYAICWFWKVACVISEVSQELWHVWVFISKKIYHPTKAD